MATKKYEKKERVDVYELLNQRMEKMLEDNLEFETPYFENFQIPYNFMTEQRYRGENIVLLHGLGYPDPRFATFLQIKEYAKKFEKDLHVKRGEHGSPVVKWVEVPLTKYRKFQGQQKDEHGEVAEALEGAEEEIAPSSEGKGKEPVILMPTVAGYVFNGTQIAGLDPYIELDRNVTNNEEIDLFMRAQQQQFGIQHVRHNKSAAYFSPGANTIYTPIPELFKSDAHRYSTELHEYVHALGLQTGADFSGKYGSEKYAKEELRAEYGAFVLCSMLGLKYDMNAHDSHAAYVKNWLKAIKNDKRYLMQAIREATKRVDLALDIFEDYKQNRHLKNEIEIGRKVIAEQERSVFPAPPARKIAVDRGHNLSFEF